MQLNEEDAWVLREVSTYSGFRDKNRIGVAVSGGSDSVALLHLMATFAQEHSLTLEAATVDHGLRVEAAAEAEFVADMCAALNIPHETLEWGGWDGTGNLQAEARKARYKLLADWGQRQKMQTIALGHTTDDQAETFLMRLGRAAGVDGLSAMQSSFEQNGIGFCRPLLAVGRQDLRAFLSRREIQWCDDPSNTDETYDRVKARKALTTLASLGIDTRALSEVASNLTQARDALRVFAHEKAHQIVRFDHGDILVDAAGLASAPAETARRILIAALDWIAPSYYPPRREALADLDTAIAQGRAFTVQGCLITADRDAVRITREYNALKGVRCAPADIWDGRWMLSGRAEQGLHIAALGDAGLKYLPDWRETGVPRVSLLSSPAIWRGETLIAAPIAGFSNGWGVKLLRREADFFSSILSH